MAYGNSHLAYRYKIYLKSTHGNEGGDPGLFCRVRVTSFDRELTNKWRSKQTKKVKKNAIYYDKTQGADFQCSSSVCISIILTLSLSLCLCLSLSLSLSLYIYILVPVAAPIYIYIYICNPVHIYSLCVCVCVCVCEREREREREREGESVTFLAGTQSCPFLMPSFFNRVS